MAMPPDSWRPRAAEVASSIFLYAAAAGSVVVTAQAMVAVDGREWVSEGSAITFLVGIFTLLAVRAQLRLGVRPLLSYSRLDDPPEETRLRPKDGRTTAWVVLRNNGLGPAVIESVAYKPLGTTSVDPPPDQPPADAVAFDPFIEQIASKAAGQHRSKRDYVMDRISVHGSLGPSESYFLGEFADEMIDQLGGIAVWVTYRGVLGPSYVKCVWIRRRTPP